MINPHLHRQPVPLDPQQHRQLKIAFPVTDWSVASRLNAVFVAATEFSDVCKEFPIVFVRAGREADGRDQIAPIAVLGVSAEQNLYLTEPEAAGRPRAWRAAYKPAVLQSYPFCIGRVDEQRFAICVDMSWPGANTEAGQPLFTAEGQPAELLTAMKQHLELLEGAIQATRTFGQRLLELDLLRDMRFDATLPGGRQHSVDGFLTVDQEKAQVLPDNVLGELHRNGMLGLIQLHWASLPLMRRLMDWHVQRNAPQAAAPAAAAAGTSAPSSAPAA
ncbi:MAG: SapC family protein [Burkholderiales bacterium]|nr:SapC family protein [Burkholderiales bacterium]